MENASAPSRSVPILRWLPYWAVLQADVIQTVRSWVYWLWVIITLVAGSGYLLYRYGMSHEYGLIQPASKMVSDLIRWTLFGSITLIVVLCAGSISGERGTMADSVLSRGISRHQYFLGKWHSRLFTVLGTFWFLSVFMILTGYFLLHEDLSFYGSLVALFAVSACLAAVISLGVTVSAMCNNTLLGVALLWVFLYGGGFALTFIPSKYPSPAKVISNLPSMLQGYYDSQGIVSLATWTGGFCLVSALIGTIYFSRRDI